MYIYSVGTRDRVIGIVTRLRAGQSGIRSRWALWLNQVPLQWVLCLLPWGKMVGGVRLTSHLPIWRLSWKRVEPYLTPSISINIVSRDNFDANFTFYITFA